jgi:hypothetical protein
MIQRQVGARRSGRLIMTPPALCLMLSALLQTYPAHGTPRCADLALVLAVDSSGSIDAGEFRMQALGYAAAFSNPEVLRAIREAGTVDIASVFWADAAVPPMIIPWQRIAGQADAAKIADGFLTVQRGSFGNTDLGDGLMAALDLIDESGRCSTRAVVNVSGDGRASTGNRTSPSMSVAAARARAERMGVTVDALANVNAEPALPEYFRRSLITGPGSFVIEAQDFHAFGAAIVRKLEREIRPQLAASLVADPRP